MSMDIWQEISTLRAELARLESLLARQYAKQAAHPVLRCGDIDSDAGSSAREYTITERDVDAQRSDQYVEVTTMPGDPGPDPGQPVMFYLDNAGKRYVLPSSQRAICVRDEGGGKGKHVEIDENGTVTEPAGSEELDYVVQEPDEFFHNATNTAKTGRIYPGMKLKSADGTGYYLIFIEGHGDKVITRSDTVAIAGLSSVTIDLDVDGQGNLLDVDLRAG